MTVSFAFRSAEADIDEINASPVRSTAAPCQFDAGARDGQGNLSDSLAAERPTHADCVQLGASEIQLREQKGNLAKRDTKNREMFNKICMWNNCRSIGVAS